jgi:23S rRNA (uridine2552-2'-O)-methyltransferase
MTQSKSSKHWLHEHFSDEYVKLAQAKGYRSRAIFKLMEIQEKDKIIKPGMNVVDLGAAPGGWSQYVRQILGKNDKIVALDILEMEALEGVDFIHGDFREPEVLEQLYQVLDKQKIDVVLSDMAPNLSGNKDTDQARAIYLGELALDTALGVLAKGGTFLVKMFQGTGFNEYLAEVKRHFTSVVIRKPKASRPRSTEVYILAKGFKKQN